MENITAYFDLLKEVFDELELSDHPECIYNMDETGVPHQKLFVKREQKRSDIEHRVKKLKSQALAVETLWDRPYHLSSFTPPNS